MIHQEQVLMGEWQMQILYLFPLLTQKDLLSPTQHWTLQGRALLGQGQPSNDHSDSATHMHFKLIDGKDTDQMENEMCKQT